MYLHIFLFFLLFYTTNKCVHSNLTPKMSEKFLLRMVGPIKILQSRLATPVTHQQ